MKKKSDLDKTFKDKIQTFLNTNNWIIAFGIIFTFFYLSLKLGSVIDEVKNTEKVVRKDIGKVIFITNDGRIIKLKKENVSYADKRIALYISNVIENHLIKDLVTISKGFKEKYSSGKELVEKFTPFNSFKKFLINPKWIYEYANNILLLISADNYPEYINPYDRVIKKFVIINSKTNEFEIQIIYKVIKRSYLRELTTLNKYKTEYAIISFKGKGVLNPAKYGNFDNPFGLKFIDLKITLLTKR